MSETVTIAEAAVNEIVQWAQDGCPEGVAGMPESVLALASSRKVEQEFAAHLVSKVTALEAANAKLRGFAEGIISDWTEYSSDQDEYEDGYEDALAECAAKARDALKDQPNDQ